MPRVHLFLIRHGQVESSQDGRFYGAAEVELSDHGREQAQQAGEFLAELALDQIWSSPLSRAQFGAAQVVAAGSREHPYDIVDRLREIDRGAWAPYRMSGLLEHRTGEWERYLADPMHFDAHGGEAVAQFCERLEPVWADLERIAAVNAGPPVQLAVVSHKFPTRYLLGKALGMPRDAWMNLEIPTGSVSCVHWSDGAWQPVCTGHVPRGHRFSQVFPQRFPQLRVNSGC